MLLKTKFEFTRHTAEIGLAIQAPNRSAFFKTASRGLVRLLLLKKPQGGRPARKKIHLQAASWEELLVDWINEIIFLIQTKRLLPRRLMIKIDEAQPILFAQIQATHHRRLALALEIKSATYHDLHIKHSKNGLKAIVILDV